MQLDTPTSESQASIAPLTSWKRHEPAIEGDRQRLADLRASDKPFGPSIRSSMIHDTAISAQGEQGLQMPRTNDQITIRVVDYRSTPYKDSVSSSDSENIGVTLTGLVLSSPSGSTVDKGREGACTLTSPHLDAVPLTSTLTRTTDENGSAYGTVLNVRECRGRGRVCGGEDGKFRLC